MKLFKRRGSHYGGFMVISYYTLLGFIYIAIARRLGKIVNVYIRPSCAVSNEIDFNHQAVFDSHLRTKSIRNCSRECYPDFQDSNTKQYWEDEKQELKRQRAGIKRSDDWHNQGAVNEH